MKNPCNPVFNNETLYKEFRAKFSIWMPHLKTLDGTDFSDDQSVIDQIKVNEKSKREKLLNNDQESSGKDKLVVENTAAYAPSGVDKSIKA